MTIINKVSAKSVMPGVTAVPDVVDAPTIGTAADVGTSRAYNNGAATVPFTAATTGGTATSFTAVSTPGSLTASGASSPLTVTGLSSATSYTFKVYGTNASGTWSAVQSAASNSITATTVPQAPTIETFTDGGTGTTGTLSFTAGATGGSSITAYKYSTDGTNYTTASGTTSPLSLTGLTAGTYTFYLKATNANGDSAASSGVSGTVITPTSFESIATITGNGTASSYTFSSIPQTYKSLQIRVFVIGGSSTVCARLNGDSGSNYSRHLLYGVNNTATAGAQATSAAGFAINCWASPSTALYGSVGITDIIDYTSTTKYKTARTIAGVNVNDLTNSEIDLISGLWRNTAAVTDITVYGNANFATGTTIALYGIK